MPFQYLITGFLLFFIVTQLHVVLSENTHTRQDASSLHSETIYWIGGLNGIWQDPKNWNLGYTPRPNQTVIIGNFKTTNNNSIRKDHDHSMNFENLEIQQLASTTQIVRILDDSEPIIVDRIILQNHDHNPQLLLLLVTEGPVFVKRELDIGKHSLVLARNSITCWESSSPCKIVVHGELHMCDTFVKFGVQPILSYNSLWNNQIHPSTSLHCMYSAMPPTDLENGGKFRLYSDKTWNWFQWLNRSSGHYCHPSLTESSPVNLLLNISRKISPHDSIHNPMEETLISNIDIFKSSTNNNEDDTFILDEVFGMPFATHEISIIIPSTKNIYQKLSSEEHEAIVQRVVTSMVKIAGGVTTLPGNIGYWMSQHSFKQELVSEEITIVTMNIPNLTKEIKRMVKEIAVSVAKDLNQEAVFVKIDTHAFLVTP